MSRTRCLGLFALLLGLSACGAAPRAWERGNLARPEMAWDPDPLQAAACSQIYASKEAASGGASAGGGGCGCSN